MTNRIWSGTVAAVIGVAAVTLAAQTTPPSQTASSSSSSDNKITVTGCLQAMPSSTPDVAGTTGTAGAAGTAGTTGTAGQPPTTSPSASASNQQFILTNAVTSPADSSGAQAGTTTGTAGTTGTTTSSAGTSTSPAGQSASSSQTYRLIANPSALSPHVGKKVELTGTIVEGSAASGASTTTQSSEPSAAANAPALKVEAGKVLTTPCSQ